jgi:hypothetical protein
MLISNKPTESNKTNCIFLRDTSFEEVSSILDFVYDGQALVKRGRLSQFLSIAEDLKIQGLSSINVLSNSEGNKEKEKYLNDHSSVINDTSDSISMYWVPILSTASSPVNKSLLQAEENAIPVVEDSQKNVLNLYENIGATQNQLQKCQTIHVADPKAGTTCQTPFDAFQCQSFESVLIKEEYTDTNSTNNYTYSDRQNVKMAEEVLTNQFKGANQMPDEIRKNRAIVWNYFNINATTPYAAICSFCGRKVKFRKCKNGRLIKSV